jgi:hypothetical protein
MSISFNICGLSHLHRYIYLLIPSPYEHLTMKQLIMKALTEHFSRGTTAKQLREFFRDAWARKIDRASLSPQLSRLRSDKIIDREGNVWFLIKKHDGHAKQLPTLKDALTKAEGSSDYRPTALGMVPPRRPDGTPHE